MVAVPLLLLLLLMAPLLLLLLLLRKWLLLGTVRPGCIVKAILLLCDLCSDKLRGRFHRVPS